MRARACGFSNEHRTKGELMESHVDDKPFGAFTEYSKGRDVCNYWGRENANHLNKFG